MVQFGSQFSKEEVVNSSESTGRFIKYFNKPQVTLRFLEEMEKTDGVPSPWTMYWEHFNADKKRSYPCLGKNNNCPGCENGDRSSKRYLTNALSNGYVDVWKIPSSVIDDLVRKSERDGGTIRARDYTIYRTGTGINTTYGVENEDREKIDLDAYASQMRDHQEALTEEFVDAWGVTPAEYLRQRSDEGSQERPSAKKETDNPLHDDASLAAFDAHVEQTKARNKMAIKKADPEPVEEVLTEEAVRAMSAEDLIELYIRCGITPPETEDQEKLADYLIDALAE